MSPIKRRPSFEAGALSPKRLRGGGLDDDDQDLFLADGGEEDFDDEPPEEFIVEGTNAVFSDITDYMVASWKRPAVAIMGNDQDLNLQWLDMDMTGGVPLTQNPNRTKPVVGSTEGQVPVLRTFGVTDAGNSVCVFIHGFTPYGYFALPDGVDFEHTAENLGRIREVLNEKLANSVRGKTQNEVYCLGVVYVDQFKSIMGYETPHKRFFQVHLSMPNFVATLKRVMEMDGLNLPGVSGQDVLFQPFECNVPYVLRYMVDREIIGAGWLSLPKECYQIRKEEDKKTHCQVSWVFIVLHVACPSVLTLSLSISTARSRYFLQ